MKSHVPPTWSRFGLPAAAVAACLVFAPGAGVASGEEMYVKRAQLRVLGGKGNLYEPVTTLKLGDKLDVVAREGTWAKVSANGKEGWVQLSALYPTPPAAAPQRTAAGRVTVRPSDAAAGSSIGGQGAIQLSVAGNGWEADRYASQRGLKGESLAKLEADARITAEELESFAGEGDVGAAR